MALTQKTGVVVLVRLILVFQDLLANVLSALVKVFVHAFRPGDWAFLFAVKILPERGDRVLAPAVLLGLHTSTRTPPLLT